MSTRSNIAIKIEEDKYKVIYCHSDGYLSHNGAILLDHYNTKEKIEELLKLGDISSLGIKINPDPNKEHSFDFDKRQDGVVVAYCRDRGEDYSEVSPKTMTLESILKNNWIDYFYIFTLDGQWKFYDYNKNKLKDLKEELESEYESIGFKRPKNYYGFLNSSILEKIAKSQKSSEDEM